jgi:hypothetical protein
MSHATVDNSRRDYAFAAHIVGARWSEAEGFEATHDADGSLLSDAACALLTQVKTQKPVLSINPQTRSQRKEALTLISFVHSEVVADSNFKEKICSDRKVHIWTMAVLLYDTFQRSNACQTAFKRMKAFRKPEHYCNDIFVIACYAIAFKYEDNGVAFLLYSSLLESLTRFSQQNAKPIISSCTGILQKGELVVLDVIEWKTRMDSPIVYIDHLIWNANLFSNNSALVCRAYGHATQLLSDPIMLSDQNYSAFYAGCVCVLQACDDLKIPIEFVFPN